MTRRDDVGELLEGDGVEDTILDEDGDNTGDAGDRYRGSLRFGTTSAEELRGESLDELLAEEEPDTADAAPGDDDDDDFEPGDREPSDRVSQREIAQMLTGGEGSHSRTDPELLGTDRGGAGLSAEEAALHEIP